MLCFRTTKSLMHLDLFRQLGKEARAHGEKLLYSQHPPLLSPPTPTKPTHSTLGMPNSPLILSSLYFLVGGYCLYFFLASTKSVLAFFPLPSHSLLHHQSHFPACSLCVFSPISPRPTVSCKPKVVDTQLSFSSSHHPYTSNAHYSSRCIHAHSVNTHASYTYFCHHSISSSHCCITSCG